MEFKRVKKYQKGSCEKVSVSGEERQKVEKFNYLGIMISADSGMGKEVAHKVLEERKDMGDEAKLWKENMISREVKRELYERAVIPIVLYGSETWSLSEEERRKIEAF